jgi:hypothetical protein
MKIICKILTSKINPKLLLLIVLAFTGGALSPDAVNSIVDILMSAN